MMERNLRNLMGTQAILTCLHVDLNQMKLTKTLKRATERKT